MAVETAAARAEVGLIRNLESGSGGFSESGRAGFAGRAAMDWFSTVIFWSDVEEGGETVFPSAKANRSSVPGYIKLYKCVKKGLVVKPKMGDALLFWSIKPDGSVDPSSLHGSCTVVKGNKWASIKLLDANEI